MMQPASDHEPLEHTNTPHDLYNKTR